MNLYLVRHAEARPPRKGVPRRLTARGVHDAQALAKALGRLALRVQAIWHSGKPRSLQTAQLLAGAVLAEEGLAERGDLNPYSSIGPVAREIRRLDHDLMIVGHQPFLGRLASKLLEDTAPDLKKVGALCLQGRRGAWRLAWLLSPGLVRRLARDSQ